MEKFFFLTNHSLFCLFDLILNVPSTIFQLYRDESSWVEPVLSKDKCVLLKDHNAVTLVRLEPAALRSRVKHSTTEPLRSQSITPCDVKKWTLKMGLSCYNTSMNMESQTRGLKMIISMMTCGNCIN